MSTQHQCNRRRTPPAPAPRVTGTAARLCHTSARTCIYDQRRRPRSQRWQWRQPVDSVAARAEREPAARLRSPAPGSTGGGLLTFNGAVGMTAAGSGGSSSSGSGGSGHGWRVAIYSSGHHYRPQRHPDLHAYGTGAAIPVPGPAARDWRRGAISWRRPEVDIADTYQLEQQRLWRERCHGGTGLVARLGFIVNDTHFGGNTYLNANGTGGNGDNGMVASVRAERSSSLQTTGLLTSTGSSSFRDR